MSRLRRKHHHYVAPPAPGVGVQALRADSDLDLKGTNIHMDASPYSGSMSTIVIPAMVDLGMRVVRSGAFNSDAPINLTNQLAQGAGTKFIFVGNANLPSYTDMSILDYHFSRVDPTICIAIEGPNEVDNNNGSYGGDPAYFTNVTTIMNSIKSWRDSNADSRIRALKLTTPTVTSAYGASHSGNTADWSVQADYGCFHPYMLPNEPLAATLLSIETDVGPINLANKPWIASETGYQTGVAVTTPSYLVGTEVSEEAQSKYIMRQYGEARLAGVIVMCMYELMDDGADLTNGESNWGFMKSDGTPKIVYNAFKNERILLAEQSWTEPAVVVGNGDYFYENFVKANQAGWGVIGSGADVNKTWVEGDGNETGRYSIVSNKGVVTSTSQTRQSAGDSHNAGHEVEFRFENYVAGHSTLLEASVRYTDNSNCYKFYVNGGVGTQLTLTKTLAGAESTLTYTSKASISTMTGGYVKIRILKVGTDNQIFCKAWADTDTEPVAWDLQWIDTGAASGVLGSGKAMVWTDNNDPANEVRYLYIKSSSVSPTVGSWSGLAAFAPGKLDFTLSGGPGTIRSILYQKANGEFWLKIWNDVSVWNSSTKTDITNAAANVTLTLNSGGAKTFNTYLPRTGITPTSLGSGTSKVIPVPDEVMLVQIS